MPAKTGVIVLAAGASGRMGRIKQLLPVLGEPAIRLCLGRICNAGVDHVIVVLGENQDRIRPVIKDFPAEIALNAKPGSQMADSVACGMALLPDKITGVMVALCDHPLVAQSTYADLAALHRKNPDSILLPVYNRRGGHPTVFPIKLCRAAAHGTPLNAVVRANAGRVCRVELNDPAIVRDMDTPEDYQQMMDLAARHAAQPV
ncbi:MAG: nucleotidyltransferase family protein [Desulfobacterales bacterium]|nr:nucleotidyltransferase family protein [Desulfobacterales bacterium]